VYFFWQTSLAIVVVVWDDAQHHHVSILVFGFWLKTTLEPSTHLVLRLQLS